MQSSSKILIGLGVGIVEISAMNRVRADVGVDVLQRELDTRIKTENLIEPGYTRPGRTGQEKYWLYGIAHTSQGVVVENGESFISTHRAFNERAMG